MINCNTAKPIKESHIDWFRLPAYTYFCTHLWFNNVKYIFLFATERKISAINKQFVHWWERINKSTPLISYVNTGCTHVHTRRFSSTILRSCAVAGSPLAFSIAISSCNWSNSERTCKRRKTLIQATSKTFDDNLLRNGGNLRLQLNTRNTEVGSFYTFEWQQKLWIPKFQLPS